MYSPRSNTTDLTTNLLTMPSERNSTTLEKIVYDLLPQLPRITDFILALHTIIFQSHKMKEVFEQQLSKSFSVYVNDYVKKEDRELLWISLIGLHSIIVEQNLKSSEELTCYMQHTKESHKAKLDQAIRSRYRHE